ncbi:MAG: acyl-CoA dehydratase activase [Deltaproteobacteria bacterium]|nr:acyl-CoA dehydratase activase [Deltaproteobacteria bacterium]
MNAHAANHAELTKSLGICIGSSTLSLVTLIRGNGHISVSDVLSRPHHGNPKQTFEETLRAIGGNGYAKVALTGRKFRNLINLTSIPEPEAVERAFRHINGKELNIQAIVSAGSETFLLYLIGRDGRISSVHAGNKCASGTGEFFLQQIKRMGIDLASAVRMAATEEPYKVSGRCSVFCKSDCTHATNKGVPKGRVTAGLCQMMAGKIMELVGHASKERIMIIGGCAQNRVMIDFLKKEISEVTVPEEAPYFEALGCALWATENETLPLPDVRNIFKKEQNTFFHLPPLRNAESMVEFKTTPRGKAEAGDVCIIGLDVGSTTTKAVLVRVADDLILAADYLRTNGDPVRAARSCYGSLLKEVGHLADAISIIGLGVTGSGRQIAGLHAMTDGVINEIIAHATGALYFDKEVDTIFEIGGQDAKYTYITNAVPSDYAMNEACSAGTGSFLEEAARETLNIGMEEIAPIALKGNCPPNFNDQCAAFISSDIKNAFNEGTSIEDIMAGLIYSVCMNYDNRVKGNRAVGRRIFMQGGVCYNRAVPLAMAALTGKNIVVPPDPGLIGAFGVALEVKNRLKLGLMKAGVYSLRTLRDREIEYGRSFVCNGGKEACDRRCTVARIRIDGRTFPFGGACNRWYNIRSHKKIDAEALNDVARYERLVFPSPETAAVRASDEAPSVGMNRSFMVNAYAPLYRTFFEQLGFEVLLPDRLDQGGIDRKGAPFCYPAEISHGFFLNLLEKQPDYLFLPHLKGDYVPPGDDIGVTCPLSQGEPYYLASAFKDHAIYEHLRTKGNILTPVLDFSGGLQTAEAHFIGMAERLGINRQGAISSFQAALHAQKRLFCDMERFGSEAVRDLEMDPDAFAVVVFGRSYNALVSQAHMGIPNKFASRGVRVIPLNALPLTEDIAKDHMYWSAGQRILRAAAYVKKHPQLFGCYITNFSCGPDSFLVGYFREVMGKKPSLTLELDSHVADAGLETRIEAFLDIIDRYRKLLKGHTTDHAAIPFSPAHIRIRDNQAILSDSKGRPYSLFDPDVHVILPSMGRFLSESGAAAFRGMGIRTSALPPADEEVLKLGRGYSSCKECLPLIITAGSLLKYVRERKQKDEKLVYFIPNAEGPCRYGQYPVFLNDLIRRLKLDDVALLSLSAGNSYAGLGGQGLAIAIWSGIVMAALFEEIYSVLLTNAVSPAESVKILEKEWQVAIAALEASPGLGNITGVLNGIADRLRDIPVRRKLADTPTILLAGEIFVRHDNISRQSLLETLAERGFAAKVSTVLEWIYYTDWCFQKGFTPYQATMKDRISLFLRNATMKRYEKAFRRALSRSNLCGDKLEDVDHLMKNTAHLINPELTGEAILTVGAVLNEVVDHYCGAIAIGPFGCMPNRLAEAILNREMNLEGKRRAGGKNGHLLLLKDKIEDLPFLAIESDGNRFPQIITARLEAFLMQAGRLHEELKRMGPSRD